VTSVPLHTAPVILVVDDQPGVRVLVQAVLEEVGYRVVTAAHGQEAVDLIPRERPALALVDLKMPVMGGLETLGHIRARYPQIPVILMTAVDDGAEVDLALAAGARTTIAKPFDVFQLRDTVRLLLDPETGASEAG
jgi:two-component system, response regulator, stage 0 sporulation protein F